MSRLLRHCLMAAGLMLSTLAAPAWSDAGVVQCTHGGDGAHASLVAYDTHRASLSGRIGDTTFNCPVAIEQIRVCGPNCHVPSLFRLYGRLDPAQCTTAGPGSDDWNPARLSTQPWLHVTPAGHRMRWQADGDSPCTAFRIEPAFAHAHRAESAIAQAPPDDLARYAGLYPHDAIAGVRFTDHPLFRAAWAGMPGDTALDQAILEDAGPWQRIHREGGLLLLEGCAAHDCLARRWTLRLRPDGSFIEACRSDAHHAPGITHTYRTGEPPSRLPAPCAWD